MFNHLRARITILMIIATLISVITISIISNITLSNSFYEYLTSQKQNRVDEIVDLIKNNYNEDGLDEREIENMKYSPLAKGFDILVKDNEGNIILAIERKNSNMHDHMMNMMGNDEKNYIVKTIDLEKNNQKIGELEIGYSDSLVVGNRELEFTRDINKSIIYSAIISIFVAISMGLYFSKFISKPIIEVKNTTNELSHGNLDISVQTRSKIKELNELTASINYLKESLKTENNLRKRLTSDISHELRTPLTILKSHIEAVQDEIWEMDKDRIEIFRKEVDRLILLVEQLKFLNNIRERNILINIEKVNLEKISNEVLKNIEIGFIRKNIRIKKNINENIFISAENDKMKQIIINLLSNSIKFTPEDGQVFINIYKENGFGIFKLKNSGEGIDKNDLPHVFERLYRTDKSRNRDRGGTGLGLAIVKEIVEAYGGNIEVESVENEFTEFIISIPLYN
ncbi:MAG: ATP-binding protein [Senegalia sp. (in: firmicutes)]|uniref:sensor histidine kinase n=1 Tax=Senegalia sp. (in: firmicutes) TaxID=1924098 RepID=UPI003F944B3B